MPNNRLMEVEVAKALGCNPTEIDEAGVAYFICSCPKEHPEFTWYHVPRFLTDWAVMGGIVEKLQISMVCGDADFLGKTQRWKATRADRDIGYGSHPLEAVCEHIIKGGR